MPIDMTEFLKEGIAWEAEQEAMRKDRRNGNGSHVSAEPSKWKQLFEKHYEGGGPFGGRNNALTMLVGFMRAKRFPYEAALAFADSWNEKNCEPPLSAHEVDNRVGRAWHEWREGDIPDTTPEDLKEKSSALVRVPLKDRIIKFADVPIPAGELPYLWGPYLNKSSTHWMTARTGLGKSTITYNIACALAEGRYLWGIDCEPTRVLYIDMESGQIGRSLKVQRLYRDSRPDIPLHFIESVSLPLENAELLTLVNGEGYEFVVFDTARRCFSVKDENDNAEFYNRIAPTLDALKLANVASLTLGHPSKNGDNSARGAGAQGDAGDINLSLSLHRGEITDEDATVKLAITKNRILGLGHPILFLDRIGDDQFQVAEVSDSEHTEAVIMQKVERVQEAVDELTRRGEKPTARAIAALARMSARDVADARRYLAENV